MSKKQAQTQPSAAEAVAASASIAPAPPFLSPWTVINSGEPQGFWKAVRVDPWRGTWVMQLGTDPHPANAPFNYGELFVGFQWVGNLPAGSHTFVARFANGPVTVKPNGGAVSADLFLTVDFRGPVQAAQRNSVQYLQVTRYFSYPGLHTISVGGVIRSSFQGAATPYAEIISGLELSHFPAGYTVPTGTQAGVQAAAAPAGLAGSTEDDAGPILFDEKKIQTVEISPREGAELRLSELMPKI